MGKAPKIPEVVAVLQFHPNRVHTVLLNVVLFGAVIAGQPMDRAGQGTVNPPADVL